METVNIYYKKALLHFARLLSIYSFDVLNKALDELTEKELETYILKKKHEFRKINFYYIAGQTRQAILGDAKNLWEATKAFSQFENFIGVPDLINS